MTKLEELKAAYEAATPGEWSVDSETHVTKWDFGKERCGCRSVAQTGHGLPTRQSDENIANAQFIALAHNNMAALLEAAVELGRFVEYLGVAGCDGAYDREIERAVNLLENLK